MPETSLFLLDANALCYRSYYAIRGLMNSRGQATNAIYGFVHTLKKIIREFQPSYMAVCFDLDKKTNRHKRFAEYKIQRPAMPEDLVSQIPIIKEIVSAYRVPIFELASFEADDIIATLAIKWSQQDKDVVIVSDDKDMYQLVNERIKIWSYRKEKILGEQEIRISLGVDPRLVCDLIGLAGDKADNIPGVHGIGEVHAKNLIKQFGSIENIFEHLNQIKSERLKEKLQAHKDMAFLSKDLARLDTQVPLEIDWDQVKVRTPDAHRLVKIFRELEFKKLTEDLSQEFQRSGSLSAQMLNGEQSFRALIKNIHKQGRFAFFLTSCQDDIVKNKEGIYICYDGQEVFQCEPAALNKLNELFIDPTIVKITHDIKKAYKLLEEMGISLPGKSFDTLLAGYLLSPSSSSHYEISPLSTVYLKIDDPFLDDPVKQTSFLAQLDGPLLQQLKEKELLFLFDEIEMPLAFVLHKMEKEGVKIDQNHLNQLSKETERKIQDLQVRIFRLTGKEFNLNSPKQLSEILFENLKLPVQKKTKTGYSTDEEVLTQLARHHEVPLLLLEYRQLVKLKSTYIDVLPQLVHPQTGRIHASFNQTGTETGRLSSSNPNLQNIPIRTELGRQIRQAFIPSQKDHVLISADYSQIELRILAHFSQDKNLMEAFKNDQDIHSFTASLIYDVALTGVTNQMRAVAKRVNFGIIYGMSAFGLAKDLNIPQGDAQEFIDKYFLRYPGVKAFMDHQIELAEQKGYVVTLLNRRRYLPEIHSSQHSLKQFAQRQAINAPVQGSAADLMKLAMVKIHQSLEEQALQSKMLITVHDELVFDVPAKEKDKMIALIRSQMENVYSLKNVPIKVIIKVGENWLDVKEVSVEILQ